MRGSYACVCRGSGDVPHPVGGGVSKRKWRAVAQFVSISANRNASILARSSTCGKQRTPLSRAHPPLTMGAFPLDLFSLVANLTAPHTSAPALCDGFYKLGQGGAAYTWCNKVRPTRPTVCSPAAFGHRSVLAGCPNGSARPLWLSANTRGGKPTALLERVKRADEPRERERERG